MFCDQQGIKYNNQIRMQHVMNKEKKNLTMWMEVMKKKQCKHFSIEKQLDNYRRKYYGKPA